MEKGGHVDEILRNPGLRCMHAAEKRRMNKLLHRKVDDNYFQTDKVVF